MSKIKKALPGRRFSGYTLWVSSRRTRSGELPDNSGDSGREYRTTQAVWGRNYRTTQAVCKIAYRTTQAVWGRNYRTTQAVCKIAYRTTQAVWGRNYRTTQAKLPDNSGETTGQLRRKRRKISCSSHFASPPDDDHHVVIKAFILKRSTSGAICGHGENPGKPQTGFRWKSPAGGNHLKRNGPLTVKPHRNPLKPFEIPGPTPDTSSAVRGPFLGFLWVRRPYPRRMLQGTTEGQGCETSFHPDSGRIMPIKVLAISGSKCSPAWASISCRALAEVQAALYGRSLVRAS